MSRPTSSPHRFQTIPDFRRQLGAGGDAAELARAVLEDLDREGRRLNAVSELNWRVAQADSGRRSENASPPSLWGIPYGIKDIFSSAGLATRYGAPPYADNVPQEDATVIKRLRSAGAVLAAKLAPIQLAGAGGYRFPSTALEGPGRNPWSPERWSGGSSSGSAIAVAAGLLPFSIGSETTGSVVVPAAFCGVTGFRPTWGAVSQYGMLSVAWSLDKAGVIARTAADCASVFRVISGSDPRDATTGGWQRESALPGPFRIGILDADFDGFPVTRRRFDAALEIMKEAGMKLSRISLPAGDYQGVLRTIQMGETAASLEQLIRSPRIGALLDSAQRAGLRRSMRQPAADYARAARERLALTAAIRGIFSRVDGLVAPTSLSEAPPIGTDLKRWAPRRRHYGWLGALAGLPGVTVPVGFGQDHLPLGMTIISDRGMDLTALAIAHDYQRRTDWHTHTPRVHT